MTPVAWTAIGVVVGVFVLLASGRVAPYLAILSGEAVLVVSGVVSPRAALAGFSNEGTVTIAALFVVAAGLNETGILTAAMHPLLGRPRRRITAQMRLVLPVSVASAFLNNTPIVAILLPLVSDWSRRIRLAASRLLLPLSYAAILGGMCTLIGTSTNLIVHGLMIESGRAGLGFFDISRVGVPCALIGVAYIAIFGKHLLPERRHALRQLEDPREYTLEMIVENGGALAGRTITQAGLRHLPGAYLMEIHRHGHVMPAVGPDEVLEPEDQLIFVGVIDSVVDLQRLPGLRPATTQLFKLDAPRAERWFVEAVVSRSCPLAGRTIRDGRFRNRYNAVVIGVARNGERIAGRIGDIALQPGDVLLLESLPNFVEQYRNSSDFYLVSRIGDRAPLRRDRGWTALGILAAMVGLAATGVLSMLQASVAAAAAMLVTRACSEEAARRRVDWQLLLAIAGAFGLGNALMETGAARELAGALLGGAGDHPAMALFLVFGITMVLSALITNNATAVVVFPVAVSVAARLGVSDMPFIMAVLIGASSSFATPLGYQTNLMVYGPGGYRMRDYVRFGLPLSLLLWAFCTWWIPRVWPF